MRDVFEDEAGLSGDDLSVGDRRRRRRARRRGAAVRGERRILGAVAVAHRAAPVLIEGRGTGARGVEAPDLRDGD